MGNNDLAKSIGWQEWILKQGNDSTHSWAQWMIQCEEMVWEVTWRGAWKRQEWEITQQSAVCWTQWLMSQENFQVIVGRGGGGLLETNMVRIGRELVCPTQCWLASWTNPPKFQLLRKGNSPSWCVEDKASINVVEWFLLLSSTLAVSFD